MQRNQSFIVCGLAAVILPLVLGCGATPHTTAPEDVQGEKASATPTHEVEYLIVLTGESATLADGVLRIGDVNPATLYFSDRPDRVAGHLTTEEFVGGWSEGDDSFASNPPNATLSILTGPEPQEVVVVLGEPRFDDGDLVFSVSVLEGNPEAGGGASSLFINMLGRPLTPLSAAGVARRTTRRAIIY
jgi:hypothetical protein